MISFNPSDMTDIYIYMSITDYLKTACARGLIIVATS